MSGESARRDALTEKIRTILRKHPVQVAVLFGSHATGQAHAGSDIDIAVAFDDLKPGDEGYNETFFGLSVALSETLETDDIDLVDVHTLSPSMRRSVFDTGTVLVGSDADIQAIQDELQSDSLEDSPRERVDAAIRRIDEHLA